ncbi:hypothetical protein OQA88_12732 [Cercophora sp. LCS_1]
MTRPVVATGNQFSYKEMCEDLRYEMASFRDDKEQQLAFEKAKEDGFRRWFETLEEERKGGRPPLPVDLLAGTGFNLFSADYIDHYCSAERYETKMVTFSSIVNSVGQNKLVGDLCLDADITIELLAVPCATGDWGS